MGNTFLRDLTLNSQAANARKIRAIEEHIAPPFRPYTKTYIGVETGANSFLTQVNSIGEIAILSSGMYLLAYQMDVGMGGTTFAESFLTVNGTGLTQAVSGTLNVGRVPHSGIWSGPLVAGDKVAPKILSTVSGLMIAYFTSFVVTRLA